MGAFGRFYLPSEGPMPDISGSGTKVQGLGGVLNIADHWEMLSIFGLNADHGKATSSFHGRLRFEKLPGN